jgi:hypothetical protein
MKTFTNVIITAALMCGAAAIASPSYAQVAGAAGTASGAVTNDGTGVGVRGVSGSMSAPSSSATGQVDQSTSNVQSAAHNETGDVGSGVKSTTRNATRATRRAQRAASGSANGSVSGSAGASAQ